MVNLHPLTAQSTHYAKLYPQNYERIVTIDSVTSCHLMYCRHAQQFRRQKFLCCWLSCVERLAVIRPTGHELQTFQEVTRTYLQAVVDRVRLRSSLTYLRYDTRCYFNVRSKADMSRLNLYRTENN